MISAVGLYGRVSLRNEDQDARGAEGLEPANALVACVNLLKRLLVK